MSTQTAPVASAKREPASPRGPIRRYPGVAIAVLLLVISTLIVIWARTRPGFDPFGWLVWGHQTLTLSLDTNAAPSWKPLPYLFTVPFALFGHYQLWLWMITAVALALAGVVFAGRIAYRLTDAPPDRRWAAWVAAAFAGAALLGIRDYSHYMLSSQSDPVIVTLVLGAIDAHLSRRPRWTFALGVLAALGRPEIWPFLAVWSLWAWRALPAMRTFIVVGAFVVLGLWFGIPALTSRTPFVAGTNALGSGRALHGDKVFGTIDRFLDMHETALELTAVFTVVWAAWRRNWTVLVLAGVGIAWVVVEIAFALHGWPGLQRYLFGAGAVMIVIAATGIGWLLAKTPPLPNPVAIAGVVIAAAVIVSMVPAAISRGRIERRDLRAQRARTKEINALAGTISRAGGAALLRQCGAPLTRLEYQTILAWNLKINVSHIGFKFGPAIHRRAPIVLFTPIHDGWKLQALHQRLPQCRRLPA